MKNDSMEKGDVIINFVGNKYQWAYCLEGADDTKTGFESGKYKPVISTNFFDTKEETILDLKKYIEKHGLKEPNIILSNQIS